MHGSEPTHKHSWDGAEKDGARGETENGPEKLGKIMHGWLGFVMWSKLTGWLVGWFTAAFQHWLVNITAVSPRTNVPGFMSTCPFALQTAFTGISSWPDSRWTFNFVQFVGMAIFDFKIKAKYLFTLVILYIIWNQVSVHEHVRCRQTRNFLPKKINDFTTDA